MKFRSARGVDPAPGQDRSIDRIRVLALVSVLLGYPDEGLIEELPVLAAGAAQLGAPTGPLLTGFIDHLQSEPLGRLAVDYVDTFDLRRRCCLYLTYYGHGDTRKRGAALVRFTQTYRNAGFPPPDGELADHLGVVCNFAALAPDDGLELLAAHRAEIELLRTAISEAGSLYMDVIDALRAVLPEPNDHDLSMARHMAGSGPPAEEVGLEPFGPPEYMGSRR
jgi:nitrate reductase delta subunit